MLTIIVFFTSVGGQHSVRSCIHPFSQTSPSYNLPTCWWLPNRKLALCIIIHNTTNSAGFVAERINETDKCEEGRTVQITQERQLSFLPWATKATSMELFNPDVTIRGLLWAASYCSIVQRPYLLHHHVTGIWKYLLHMKRCGEPRQHTGCCLTKTQLIWS